MRAAAIVLILTGSAWAQVSAPLLGWLPESKQIRAMNGLPGAAALGDVVNAGRKLAAITVSPSQNYVLAKDGTSGQVLLILPGVSTSTVGVAARPDLIAVSPRGASAGLWYSSTSQFEVLSGLPSSIATRQIDASFLNAPISSMAVSDDGQSIAAVTTAGVYLWGANGIPQQVYGAGDAGAIAFYSGNSNLLIATSTEVLSISGSASAVLNQGSFNPAGVGASFDNSKIVLANQDGTIDSIDTTTRAVTNLDCVCGPSGVFGLGGDVFRLTSSAIGPVKLVDASAGAILAIPRKPPETRVITPEGSSTQPLPSFSIHLNPAPTGYLQQPAMTVTASAAYPVAITGNVVLTFTSAESGTDTSIQFSNASTTVNFTIPAGSTQANFSGAPSITFSTGTIAGTIALVANVTAPAQVSSVATQSVTTVPGIPVVESVTTQITPGVLTINIVGYSSTDEMTSATFSFTLASGATLNANDITVPVSPQFQPYYAAATSYPTGSEFTLSVPFGIQGNLKDITAVTVTLLNNRGVSNPVTSQ
jgi:hypothetical protein